MERNLTDISKVRKEIRKNTRIKFIHILLIIWDLALMYFYGLADLSKQRYENNDFSVYKIKLVIFFIIIIINIFSVILASTNKKRICTIKLFHVDLDSIKSLESCVNELKSAEDSLKMKISWWDDKNREIIDHYETDKLHEAAQNSIEYNTKEIRSIMNRSFSQNEIDKEIDSLYKKIKKQTRIFLITSALLIIMIIIAFLF